MARIEEVKQTLNIQRSTSNAQGSRNWIAWRIVDLSVGVLFIYAGVIKALDPGHFAIDIDNYKILPWTIAVRLAFYLPWLEMLCGLALILEVVGFFLSIPLIRRLYRGGLAILTGLILVFILGSVVAKAHGLDIKCGCFGHLSDNLSFTWHLALVFVLLAALVALLLAARHGGPESNAKITTS